MTSVPSHLGEYQLVRRAATGATSDVYEGRHSIRGDRVAVKVLHHEWCLHLEVVARFLNEAQALHRIQHPHLASVISWGASADGPPYTVLEWLPASLDRALEPDRQVIPVPIVLRIALQLADALVVLHERGVIHRDLKPANVLMTSLDLADADVKIADLGLAKIRAGEGGGPAALPVSTGGSELLGTWDYMAPEQWIRSKDAGPKVDVYALGVVMFQMLSGRLPFIADREKDLMFLHLFEPPPLALLDPVVPPEVRALLAGMLDKKISGRPTMVEIRERLTSFARGHPETRLP